MSSSAQDVSKMVGIYKKLFLVLVIITAVGIGIAFLHLPAWPAVIVALAVIAVKGKVVLDAFQDLLKGKFVLILTFLLTAFFFAGLVILPLLNHHDVIVGTEDISKEVQMQQPAAPEGHHGD